MNHPIDMKTAARVFDRVRNSSSFASVDKLQLVESQFLHLCKTFDDYCSAECQESDESGPSHLLLSLSITRFVTSVVIFYLIIRNQRELDDDEKQIQGSLLDLERQATVLLQKAEDMHKNI